MNATELQHFKELLLQQRADILNKTEAFRNDPIIEASTQGDEIDLAVSENTLNTSLRLREREIKMIPKIDHALAKIEEGSFGLCEGCEEHLTFGRLMARPFATLCIACKEEEEKKNNPFT